MASDESLGHFYLTQLLMPALMEGRNTSPDRHSRVITTSSGGAYLATLHWDTFKDGAERRRTSDVVLYNQSKLVDCYHCMTFDRGLIQSSF